MHVPEDVALPRFRCHRPPVEYSLGLVDAHVIAIHTLVSVSTINVQTFNLERNAMTGGGGGEPFKRCLTAVSSIVSVIKQLQEDYPSLDPLMSICAPCCRVRTPLLNCSPLIQLCWVTAVNVCLHVISSSRPPENTDFVQKYLGVLIGVVQQLARFYQKILLTW